jgi:hypothetical protein
MKNPTVPGRPLSSTPPPGLLQVLDSLQLPSVAQAGLTTTPDGEWALSIRPVPERSAPLPEVEAAAAGYPIVYEANEAYQPVARPAYPQADE